jgi:AraC-like DNA-binding protein
LHPKHRFDYWHSIACDAILPHAARPRDRQSFSAELKGGAIADIDLVLHQNSPMTIRYATRHRERSAVTNSFFICQQLAGSHTLEQCEREVRLEPGSLTIVDPRLPFHGKFAAGSSTLLLRVPREFLEGRIGTLRDLAARPMVPDAADFAFASAFFSMLPRYANKLTQRGADLVQQQTVDLVAHLLGRVMGDLKSPSHARSLIFLRVSAAIEKALPDHRSDAAGIAAAAGVSVRYANSVLRDRGTSIMELLQIRRLERCRQALEDESQARRSISEIAYGWGFSDMTHFGRRFRAAYGMLPSEYRMNGKDQGSRTTMG